MTFERNGTLAIFVLLIIVLGVLGKIYYDNNCAAEQFDPVYPEHPEHPEQGYRENTTRGMHSDEANEWSRRYGRRRSQENFDGGCPGVEGGLGEYSPEAIEEGALMEGEVIEEGVMESDPMMEADPMMGVGPMEEVEPEIELVPGQEVPHEMTQEESVAVGQEHPVMEGIVNHHELNKNQPHVDPQTGILMDGPGFSRDRYTRSKRARRLIPPNYYFIDDGANGEMSIQHNLCSKSCCSEQWPTPFKQKYDPFVCKNKDKFIPSNIFCNNSFQDSGCLCLNKKQAQFMYNRGGNGRESF